MVTPTLSTSATSLMEVDKAPLICETALDYTGVGAGAVKFIHCLCYARLSAPLLMLIQSCMVLQGVFIPN